MAKSSSAKRIQKELAEISLDPPCNCSAGPKGDNIYEWVSTIVGPSGDTKFRWCTWGSASSLIDGSLAECLLSSSSVSGLCSLRTASALKA